MKKYTYKKYLPAIGLVIITILVILMLLHSVVKAPTVEDPTTHQMYKVQTVKIGDKTNVSAEVADESDIRELGLSYRPTLAENSGMLFVFDQPDYQTFWMKGMNFPLDMIWIGEDKKIVDITAYAPAPEANASDMSLPTYSPKVPAKYVLEVNGGFASKNQIHTGDTVEF